MSGQVRSGQVRSGQIRSGQIRSSKIMSGQVRSGQVRSGQVRSDHVRSCQVVGGEDVINKRIRTAHLRVIDGNNGLCVFYAISLIAHPTCMHTYIHIHISACAQTHKHEHKRVSIYLHVHEITYYPFSLSCNTTGMMEPASRQPFPLALLLPLVVHHPPYTVAAHMIAQDF